MIGGNLRIRQTINSPRVKQQLYRPCEGLADVGKESRSTALILNNFCLHDIVESQFPRRPLLGFEHHRDTHPVPMTRREEPNSPTSAVGVGSRSGRWIPSAREFPAWVAARHRWRPRLRTSARKRGSRPALTKARRRRRHTRIE